MAESTWFSRVWRKSHAGDRELIWGMRANLRADILEQLKALEKPTIVPTKFGGIDCFIRRWNSGDRVRWAIELQTAKEKQTLVDDEGNKSEVDSWFQIKAIAKSLCDENGDLLFDDYRQVAVYDQDVLNPVFAEVIKLQNVGIEEDEDAAKKN